MSLKLHNVSNHIMQLFDLCMFGKNSIIKNKSAVAHLMLDTGKFYNIVYTYIINDIIKQCDVFISNTDSGFYISFNNERINVTLEDISIYNKNKNSNEFKFQYLLLRSENSYTALEICSHILWKIENEN